MSDRSEKKAAARERMLDQIALDKLRGLEDGKICRAYYKALKPKPTAPIKRSKIMRRKAETYRAARRMAQRGSRRSLWCKAERGKRGETRPEFDRRREAERRAAP